MRAFWHLLRAIAYLLEYLQPYYFTDMSFIFSNWPAFVPVHDPSRKAYIGIQNMGTVFTRRFEADRIGSQVPIRLMHLEGLHELFLSKFVSVSCNLHCFLSFMRLYWIVVNFFVCSLTKFIITS
jgi:hypothetical protein